MQPGRRPAQLKTFANFREISRNSKLSRATPENFAEFHTKFYSDCNQENSQQNSRNSGQGLAVAAPQVDREFNSKPRAEPASEQ